MLAVQKTSAQNSTRQGATAELRNTCPHICMRLHSLGEKSLPPLEGLSETAGADKNTNEAISTCISFSISRRMKA
jgi:hypothetical protein